MERGEGERLHARRRKRFWTLIGGLALVGFVTGLVWGLMIAGQDDGAFRMTGSMRTLGAAGLVIAALLTIYVSWRFFVTVDELEVADNLWGSLIGFYAYLILFPLWWALNKLERAPPPDHWVIYGASLLVAGAAYGWRKWQSR